MVALHRLEFIGVPLANRMANLVQRYVEPATAIFVRPIDSPVHQNHAGPAKTDARCRVQVGIYHARVTRDDGCATAGRLVKLDTEHVTVNLKYFTRTLFLLLRDFVV